MTTHKRKKAVRYRGSHTHGGGAKKKRRGGGHRGGRGMAGTGKRADSKKPSIDVHTYFGKHGFIKKNARVIASVNLDYIDTNADALVAQGKAEKKADGYHIDLAKMGFDKLLGEGAATRKLRITAKHASAGAVEKVKKAGGAVTVLEQKEAKANAEAADEE